MDSRLLAEVYLELRGGKQFSMDLNQKELKKDFNKKTKLNSSSKTTKLQPTQEEIRLHKEMIKDIKDAFWNKNPY